MGISKSSGSNLLRNSALNKPACSHGTVAYLRQALLYRKSSMEPPKSRKKRVQIRQSITGTRSPEYHAFSRVLPSTEVCFQMSMREKHKPFAPKIASRPVIPPVRWESFSEVGRLAVTAAEKMIRRRPSETDKQCVLICPIQTVPPSAAAWIW